MLAHRAGDPRALDVLYRRHRLPLVRYLTLRMGHSRVAEDLVQDTFVRVVKHIDRFDADKGSFKTWLYTIGLNLAKNALRRQGNSPLRDFCEFRRPDGSLAVVEERADPKLAPDRLYEERDLEARARAATGSMRAKHRVVFELCDLEGRSYDEIASLTGLPLGTVKSRIFRARSTVIEAIRAA